MAHMVSFDDGESLDIDTKPGAYGHVWRFLKEHGASSVICASLGKLFPEPTSGVLFSFEKELFRFESEAQWVNKAKTWFASCGVPKHRYVAVDAAGRVCTSGREFMRATKEDTYPITVYEI